MRETDIRPAEIFRTYLDLSVADAGRFFADKSTFINRACPGCGADRPEAGFDKNGFSLSYCRDCRTLYVDPVPPPAHLAAFYRDSDSQKYWASTFFPAVAEARREKIFRPRVERIAKIVATLAAAAERVVDVGAGAGIFLEECRAVALGCSWHAVEPNVDLAATCRAKGFDTFEGFADAAARDGKWKGHGDLVVSFEVIEHVPQVDTYMRELAALARPGGLLIVSGLCGSGFDIAVLGKRSNAVSPPHHLNFLSRIAIQPLLARCGLELVDFLTPGALDVDIVRNALKSDADAVADRFLRELIGSGSDEERAALQTFLSAHGLSSHMWIIARRPANQACP